MNGQYMLSGGQGEAFILPATDASGLSNQIHYLNAQKRQKEATALKAKQAQDKEFAEAQKWNPGKAWYFHTDELNNKVKNVYDLQTQAYQRGDNSPEMQRKIMDAKWDAEVTAKKSQDIQKMYPQLVQQADSLDIYEDKALVKTKLNDEVLRKGSVNEFDFDRASDIKGFTGNDTFQDRKWAVDFAKSIPDTVQSQINNMGGGVVNDKEFKSKYYELDANGKPKVGANGVYVIKDSPEVLVAMKQEPRIVNKATEMVEAGKYKTIDEALREEYIRPYASSSVKESQTTGWKPTSGKGSDKDDAMSAPVNDVERLRNRLNPTNNTYSTEKGWVAIESDLNQNKFKKVLLNPTNAIDTDDASKPKNKHAGNYSYTLTKVQLLPVDAKTGRIIHGEKKGVLNHKNGIVYKPFIEGTREVKNDEGRVSLVTETFPYEQAKSYLDTEGITEEKLKEMGFIDPLGKKLNRGTKSENKKTVDPLKLF